jgi:hypothetical protein
LRIDGRPFFVWYHLGHFERPGQVVEMYRRCCQDRGFDPLVAHFVKNPFDAQYAALVEVSFLFEPRLFFGFRRGGRGTTAKKAMDLLSRTFGERLVSRLLVLADSLQGRRRVFTAQDFLAYLASPQRRAFAAELSGLVQEVVSPGWNNAPRYGSRYTVLEDLPAEPFGCLVRAALTNAKIPPLINAWNEWSEGAAIEPCAYLGRVYLDAISRAVARADVERTGDFAAAPRGAAHRATAP